jgi:hypothetical protein
MNLELCYWTKETLWDLLASYSRQFEWVITIFCTGSCSGSRFSSPKFARVLDWRLFFWDQNLCIVSDDYSPISSTGIDKIKHLSIIYIHIILLIFIIHRTNRPWLKVEVIHATKWRCARLSGISQIWSSNSSSPQMKRKVILPGNHLQNHIVYIHE